MREWVLFYSEFKMKGRFFRVTFIGKIVIQESFDSRGIANRIDGWIE